MSIDKRDLPLIRAGVKINRVAYIKTMQELLTQLAGKKSKPTQALRTRIISANELFERLERALDFISDGVEEYE